MNSQGIVTGLGVSKGAEEAIAGNGNAVKNEPSQASEDFLQTMSAMALAQLLFSALRKERYILIREVLGFSMVEWTDLIRLIHKSRPISNDKNWEKWSGVEIRALLAYPDKRHDIMVVCLKAIGCMMMCGGAEECFASHGGGLSEDSHESAAGPATNTHGGNPIKLEQRSASRKAGFSNTGLGIDNISHTSIENAPSGPRIQNVPTGPRLQNIPCGPRATNVPSGPRLQNIPSGPRATIIPSGPRVQNIPSGPRATIIPSGPRLQNIPSGPRATNAPFVTYINPAIVGYHRRRANENSILEKSRHANIPEVPAGHHAQDISKGSAKAEATTENDAAEELNRSIMDMISHYSNIPKVTSKGEVGAEPTTMGNEATQTTRSMNDPKVEPVCPTPVCQPVKHDGDIMIPAVLTPTSINEIPHYQDSDIGDGVQDSGVTMAQLMTPEQYMLRQEAYDNTSDGWVVDRIMDVNPHIGTKRKADKMLESPDTSTHHWLENPDLGPSAPAHPAPVQSLATPTAFHQSISFYIGPPFLQLPYGSMFVNSGRPPQYQLVRLQGLVPLAYFLAELRHKHAITPDLIVTAIQVVVGAKSFFLSLVDLVNSEMEWAMVVGLMLLGEEQVAYVSVAVEMVSVGRMAVV